MAGVLDYGLSTSVQVSNLNVNINQEDLRSFFADCGEITSIQIKTNSPYSCYAIIEFSSPEMVDKAYQKDGKCLNFFISKQI